MRKISLRLVKKLIVFFLCASILIFFPVFALQKNEESADASQKEFLTVWQIDSFEGGKGSRTAYLQNLADEFSQKSDCYLTVTAISLKAALMNMNSGNIPDVLSYGAGASGLEGFLKGKIPYYTWCNGGYCILSMETGADFNDITPENTVINGGTDNLSGAAALLCGLSEAKTEKPTAAYVHLINGKYKYLLGTQRDIFRLKTRGVTFSVKPVEEFNDLYQNISITSVNPQKIRIAEQFIDYVLRSGNQLAKIGLMQKNLKLYDDEMRDMEGIEYKVRLVSPVSEKTKEEINSAIINSDENKLKYLLK